MLPFFVQGIKAIVTKLAYVNDRTVRVWERHPVRLLVEQYISRRYTAGTVTPTVRAAPAAIRHDRPSSTTCRTGAECRAGRSSLRAGSGRAGQPARGRSRYGRSVRRGGRPDRPHLLSCQSQPHHRRRRTLCESVMNHANLPPRGLARWRAVSGMPAPRLASAPVLPDSRW